MTKVRFVWNSYISNIHYVCVSSRCLIIYFLYVRLKVRRVLQRDNSKIFIAKGTQEFLKEEIPADIKLEIEVNGKWKEKEKKTLRVLRL